MSTAPRSLDDWLALLEARHPADIDLDLSRCGAVYRRLGSPRPGRRVITVAGTNGKGSTVAWACAALDALDYRQGAYTSPHLLCFNERLRLLGEMVDTATLLAAFEAVEAARGDTSLTYFEFTTLACFTVMAGADLDVAVLEVGLGGRLDTVNLVDADVSVITPVGLDHQVFLGDDRETIGREKAGILRRRRPVVLAESSPPESVLASAQALDCPVSLAGRDFDLSAVSDGAVCFRLGNRTLELPRPSLGGAHQFTNLGGALAAVFTLFPGAWPVMDGVAKRLARAVAGVQLAGRLQVAGPPPGYLLDVGHNPMAATVVRQRLAANASGPCVLGMLADKDAEAVATILAPVVSEFLCAGLRQGGRSQSGEALARRVGAAVPDATVRAFPDVSRALETTRNRPSAGAPTLVFGSFHTAAEALCWLRGDVCELDG